MESQPLPPLQPGTLYLVAPHIGTLEDITLRALRTLKECDLVAAEDTRHTGHLLKHFAISRPLLSYFQFNEARRSEETIERLKRGEKIALVTDAGSPGISVPGERVVRAVIAAGLRVEPVPGPCALVAALTASGLGAEEFHFVGFSSTAICASCRNSNKPCNSPNPGCAPSSIRPSRRKSLATC